MPEPQKPVNPPQSLLGRRIALGFFLTLAALVAVAAILVTRFGAGEGPLLEYRIAVEATVTVTTAGDCGDGPMQIEVVSGVLPRARHTIGLNKEWTIYSTFLVHSLPPREDIPVRVNIFSGELQETVEAIARYSNRLQYGMDLATYSIELQHEFSCQ